jgi:putative transposase
MDLLLAFLYFVRAVGTGRVRAAAENLALRQQLAILQRSVRRPRLRQRDRFFWVCLSRWLSGWQTWLVIVKPETVIGWHRRGFRCWWRWKSRSKPGRPAIPRDLLALIRRFAKDNPTWGVPRIRSELHLLGHDVAASTIAKYLPKGRKPPSQHWKTFLKNHVGTLACVDFFVVPTATFRLLFGFVVLCLERRRVVHFNVTAHPTAVWVAHQLRQAFPFDTAPRYLIRDRDSIYGEEVRRCLANLGIEEVLIAPRSPWQNPFVERLIGSIRREYLDHVIVLGERHLLHLLTAYFTYYHQARPHMALENNAPEPREVEGVEPGRVVAVPMVGGLHHRYRRSA